MPQAIHTNPEFDYLYFDLFSCRRFDIEEVAVLLDRAFGVVEWETLRRWYAPSAMAPVIVQGA